MRLGILFESVHQLLQRASCAAQAWHELICFISQPVLMYALSLAAAVLFLAHEFGHSAGQLRLQLVDDEVMIPPWKPNAHRMRFDLEFNVLQQLPTPVLAGCHAGRKDRVGGPYLVFICTLHGLYVPFLHFVHKLLGRGGTHWGIQSSGSCADKIMSVLKRFTINFTAYNFDHSQS